MTSITPSSVSPVLTAILTITVADYPVPLVASDLSVKLVSRNKSSIVRYQNVVETGPADNGQQYLKIKFGGSESGIYDVHVRSLSYGNFNSTGITLELIGTVADFNPKRGSVYGGTLVTITGHWFSSDPTNNPVRIGTHDCLVEQSSENQIICRTTPTRGTADETLDMIVFLKTYEEAVCQVNPCKFDFVMSGLASLTSYSVDFDSTLHDYVLTLVGTNFGAFDGDNSEVVIDGFHQVIISANDTVVQAHIVNMLDSATSNVVFYLPIGVPAGTDDLTRNVGISLTPQFLSLTPNVGSPAGSLVTASVPGVGVNTMNVTLVDSNGKNLCKKVTIPSYGVVQCLTLAATVADTTVQLTVNGTPYTCQGSACNYQTSDAMPVVTAVAKQDAHTLVFTGVGFQLTGFPA